MEKVSVFAIDWHSLLVPKIPLIDIVMRTVLVYAMLQVGLRMLGRKDLQHGASHNMVMLFLVGAFGGRAVLGEDTSMTAGALGLAVVLSLNWAMSYASYRSPRLAAWIEGPVHHLVVDGVLQRAAMARARCSEDMLHAQLRMRGVSGLDKIDQAYMERTGELTFLLKD